MFRIVLAAVGIALAAVLVVVAAPFGASAAPQCGEHTSVVSHLKEKYGEAPVALGLTSSGALIEVLATASGSTWSIIATVITKRPDGTEFRWACLVQAGEGWRTAPVAAVVDPGA